MHTEQLQKFASKDTDSCFGIFRVTILNVKPFVITGTLQRSLRTNQLLPRVTTRCCRRSLPPAISEYKEEACFTKTTKLKFLINHHTEADLVEECVPVGW